MVTQTIVLASHPEQLGSVLQLFDAADGLIQSAPAQETSYGSAVYAGLFTDAPAATYRVKHVDASGEVVWTSAVALTLTTATFTAHDAAWSAAGGGSSDWDVTERSQIRQRLGIDGTAAAPAATPSLARPGDAMSLQDGAVTAAKIADNAFTAAKFANGAFDAIWTVATRSLTTFGTLSGPIRTGGSRSRLPKHAKLCRTRPTTGKFSMSGRRRPPGTPYAGSRRDS